MSEIVAYDGSYGLEEGSGAPSRSLEWADSPWKAAPQSPAAMRQVIQIDSDGLGADLGYPSKAIGIGLAALALWVLWAADKPKRTGLHGLRGLAEFGDLGASRRARLPREETRMKSVVGDLSIYTRTDR